MIYSSLATLESFTIAYTESDVFGKLIILSLILLSALCWVVVCFKVWQAKKVKKLSHAFEKALKKYKDDLLSADFKNLPRPAHPRIPNPYACILRDVNEKTLETLNKKLFFIEKMPKTSESKPEAYLSNTDIELLESYAYTTISSQSKILEKDLFILSTVVTLAPFLGLLGTVWGILVTFSELQHGASAGSNATIIGGLSTALSTTVLGLVIAIPALIAYNYLKNNLKTFSADMEDFLHNILSTLELQYRKVDI